MSEYELTCMICHRSERVAGKMQPIMGGMSVCNDCMQRTMDMVRNFNFSGGNMNMEDIAAVAKEFNKAMAGAGNMAEADNNNSTGNSNSNADNGTATDKATDAVVEKKCSGGRRR